MSARVTLAMDKVFFFQFPNPRGGSFQHVQMENDFVTRLMFEVQLGLGCQAVINEMVSEGHQ